MAPANTLDWAEPCQQWRYPKLNSGPKQGIPRSNTVVGPDDKEATSGYKKICKFLKRLKSTKRELRDSAVYT